MIGEQKNLSNSKIKTKKKGVVKFHLVNDSIKQLEPPPYTKRQSSEAKIRKFIYSTPRKYRQTQKISSTDIVSKRDSYSESDQMKNTLDDIQQRGCSFFKIGFLSSEKKGVKKRILAEFFNLKHDQMKGTMSVGQLWSNKQRSNFFKQNKIYINKVKLVEKINKYSKQQQFNSKKIQSQNSIFSSQNYASSSPGTFRTIPDSQARMQNFGKDITKLRKQAAKLQREGSNQQINLMLRNLQNYSQNIGRLQQKYFVKLIDMI